MTSTDTVFAGSIPALYDHYNSPLFEPYAEQIASRLEGMDRGALLEVAAGTGIVTAALARALPAAVAITATDLNPPMLEFAAGKPGMERVTWRQADAMALPFPDASFDAVVCQFGVMFFPDKPRAHAEAHRVLRAGGRYLFNLWDAIETNEAAYAIEEALAARYPARPPRFLSRTPMGYHDRDRVRADLHAGGFADCTIEVVKAEWIAGAASDPAIGFTQGSPLRADIEAADPAGVARATEAATAALAAKWGGAPVTRTQAVLVTAVK